MKSCAEQSGLKLKTFVPEFVGLSNFNEMASFSWLEVLLFV